MMRCSRRCWNDCTGSLGCMLVERVPELTSVSKMRLASALKSSYWICLTPSPRLHRLGGGQLWIELWLLASRRRYRNDGLVSRRSKWGL